MKSKLAIAMTRDKYKTKRQLIGRQMHHRINEFEKSETNRKHTDET